MFCRVAINFTVLTSREIRSATVCFPYSDLLHIFEYVFVQVLEILKIVSRTTGIYLAMETFLSEHILLPFLNTGVSRGEK